jgi:RNA polymerase I-specific transcription initiation factor RRN6
MGDRRNPLLAARANTGARVAPDSIIGRLTYTPARGDESIGHIRRNLAKGESELLSPACPLVLDPFR